jgi:hypothetical protein
MQVTVSLDQQQWAQVINLLGEYPHNKVGQLILTMQHQLVAQLQRQQPQRSNGEAVPEMAPTPPLA